MDLEATGLKNSGRPRITELSLVAVNTQDLLPMQVQILSLLKKQRKQSNLMQVENLLPRVMNKLTLSVYPMATIMPEVTRITGLDNYNLTGQERFDRNLGDMINSFLARLPSPVCLVAHNGNSYDIPLLKAEMKQAGRKLESNILYVDSLIGIKEIFNERKMFRRQIAYKKQMKWLKNRKILQKEKQAATDLMNAGEFDIDMETGNNNNQKTEHSNLQAKHANEKTPPRSNTKIRETCSHKMVKLNPVYQELKQKELSPQAITPKSFSLVNLHSHFLGVPPSQSHGAEADCLALLRTTTMLGHDWIDWAEKNSQNILHCVEMWGKTEKSPEDRYKDM